MGAGQRAVVHCPVGLRVCVTEGLHTSVSLCASSQHLFTFAIVLFLSFFVSFVSGLSVLLSVVPTLYFFADSHRDGSTCTHANARVDIVYCRDVGFVYSPFLSIYQEL